MAKEMQKIEEVIFELGITLGNLACFVITCVMVFRIHESEYFFIICSMMLNIGWLNYLQQKGQTQPQIRVIKK